MEHAPQARRETWGAVVGIAAGLALIAAGVTWIASRGAHSRDGNALLEAWFPGRAEKSELPFGLSIVDAATLASGEDMLRLVRTNAEPEPEKQAPPEKPAEASAQPPASSNREERVDWGRLPPGRAGEPPRTVWMVRYPKERAKAELERLFGPQFGGQSIGDIGPEGGRVRVDSGALPWGAFDANWVYSREFERGGTFVDSVAVNLARADLAIVLFANWTRGDAFSKERTAELIAALTP